MPPGAQPRERRRTTPRWRPWHRRVCRMAALPADGRGEEGEPPRGPRQSGAASPCGPWQTEQRQEVGQGIVRDGLVLGAVKVVHISTDALFGQRTLGTIVVQVRLPPNRRVGHRAKAPPAPRPTPIRRAGVTKVARTPGEAPPNAARARQWRVAVQKAPVDAPGARRFRRARPPGSARRRLRVPPWCPGESSQPPAGKGDAAACPVMSGATKLAMKTWASV